MKNKFLDDIKNDLVKKLNKEYGYCGEASGPENATINSSDEYGNDIEIVITVKKDDDE